MSVPLSHPLILERLSVRRSGRRVLSEVSAEVPAGTALALRGPNGAGKSTLLRCLAGLIPVEAGDARLGSLSLARATVAFREAVLYGGHRDAVKPALSVRDNLALWARLEGTPDARVEAALARFGLERIAPRPAAECSAGQARRLGLARLLVIDRPVWLLDEPTVSLDAGSVALLAEIVHAHLAGGGIALIATHADLGLGPLPVLAIGTGDDASPERGGRTPATVPGPDAARAGPPIDPFLDGHW